jgi:hypothetical protein
MYSELRPKAAISLPRSGNIDRRRRISMRPEGRNIAFYGYCRFAAVRNRLKAVFVDNFLLTS